jgi:tetratricopeptide (TPR) repeat protein
VVHRTPPPDPFIATEEAYVPGRRGSSPAGDRVSSVPPPLPRRTPAPGAHPTFSADGSHEAISLSDVAAVDSSGGSPISRGAILLGELDDSDPIATREPDFVSGRRAGAPENVEEILHMLEGQGIFERPKGEPAVWAKRKEARVERTKIGLWLGIAWVLAIGAGVGGWFGWQEFVRRRHVRAEELIAQARSEAQIGDHQRLVDAERHLREARELHPNEPTGPSVLLFVHSQRALEDGEFEVGYLRPTIARAERLSGNPHALHAARAVVALGESDAEAARTSLDHALEGEGANDAAVRYIAGRLEQRFGDADRALEHLQASVERDPALGAPSIALAEARYDEGRPEDAIALLDRVLEREAQNLRAQLWKAFLTADETEPAAGIAALAPLDARLEHGAATDRVLIALTRARLLRRQGDHAGAGAAVDLALEAGAQEPRLLALMARAARTAGRLLQAEYAATAAVRASPSSAERTQRAPDAVAAPGERPRRALDDRPRRAARRQPRGDHRCVGGARSVRHRARGRERRHPRAPDPPRSDDRRGAAAARGRARARAREPG